MELGVTVPKQQFSEWYIEVVRKGEFVDQRTPIKGCNVFMPWGYAIWEQIQRIADPLFKTMGVSNVYFPVFIPKSLLELEAEHFEKFTPEVAWVTRGGSEELKEWLAVRPTSETIMYYMFSHWIRSWRDLPLKINQWVNVVRWETKATKPFLRDREFLWQEGHTAHATLEDANNQVMQVIDVYTKILREYLALPFLILQRTESDKFAGAFYSVALDTFIPEAGRFLQLATVHNLGQNFSKAFDITFLDKDEKRKYVWQTSWGFSTRLLGAIIATHVDDKGAILPPRVAPVQVVIVPIVYKGKEEVVLRAARELEQKLRNAGIRVLLDDREMYTPGWKFNYWELKGVPLRVEIGPKDVENGGFTAARRDTGEKVFVKNVEDLQKLLEEIQQNLLRRAEERFMAAMTTAKSLDELKQKLTEKKYVRAVWCGSPECEQEIKEKTGGEIRGHNFIQPEKPEGSCIVCGKEGRFVVYIGRSF